MEAPSNRADHIASTYGVYIYPNTDLEALECDLIQQDRDWKPFRDTSFALNRGDFKRKLVAYSVERRSYKQSHHNLGRAEFCDDETTVFCVYRNFQNGSEESSNNLSRSLVFLPESNWIQAPTPSYFTSRFSNLTQYSGKFLIFIEKTKILEVWNIFKRAHLEGKLGYGLRVSSEKKNPHNKQEALRLITVHIENCFDLTRVGCIAWEINQLLNCGYTKFTLLADIASELSHFESGDLTKSVYTFIPSHFKSKPISQYVGHFILNSTIRSQEMRKLFDLTVTTPEFY
jgi:hypothetical protein